jgi:hypothetical protein
LRVWDRLDEDLVEREVNGDATPCLTLGWTWVISRVDAVAGAGPVLRLKDAAGNLVATSEEVSLTRAGEAVAREKQAEGRAKALEDELAQLRARMADVPSR